MTVSPPSIARFSQGYEKRAAMPLPPFDCCVSECAEPQVTGERVEDWRKQPNGATAKKSARKRDRKKREDAEKGSWKLKNILSVQDLVESRRDGWGV